MGVLYVITAASNKIYFLRGRGDKGSKALSKAPGRREGWACRG